MFTEKKIIGNFNKHPAYKAQNLNELYNIIKKFDLCDIKKMSNNTVFSDGVQHAPIMVIGEAPGLDEDRFGKPFVGASGILLDKIFNSIGCSRRTNLYITNILPWRPPGNRAPTDSEIALCLPFVEMHISFIRPDYLILVGGTATKALLKTKLGIVKTRGIWYNYKNKFIDRSIKTLPIYHPSYLLRAPGNKRQAWFDMLLIKKELENNF